MKNVKINDVENDFLKYFNEGMKYDDICSKLNVTKASISYYVKKHNLVHPSKINKINDTIFNSFNEENIYWLGYLWADGSVQNTEKNHTIDLETIDKEHAIKFSKFLGLNKIKERNRNNSITFRVNGSSKKIANKLYELGFDIKDNRINFPNMPKEYYRVFLRGYFDGDGHIRIKNEKFEAIDISGRLEFMDTLYNMFPYFIRKELHSTHSERIYSNKELGIKFLNYIYKDAKIYLERKFKCALLFCKDR